MESGMEKAQTVEEEPVASVQWTLGAGLLVEYSPEEEHGHGRLHSTLLATEAWVLTAAHCFRHGNASLYLIKAGKHNLTRNETSQQEIEPEKIFVHHEYRIDNDFDIALVKLKREVKINSFVRPVCLPKKAEGDQAIPMTNGVVSGWGITRALPHGQAVYRHEIPEVLRHAVFTIRSNQLCSNKTSFVYNSTVTFCAGDGKGKRDSCVGDSGGAFVREIGRRANVHWVAVGIVSWGEGCAQKDKYGYYVRVYPFIDWIEKTMEDLDGGYSQWTFWSQCSATCDNGTQQRRRTCTAPSPANGGKPCTGRSHETRMCINNNTCPSPGSPIHGGYSHWSSWTSCSRTCAGGTQDRSRSCTNPRPANGGRDCSRLGRETERRQCNRHSCPVAACTDIAAANQCRRWSNNRQCSRRTVKRGCKKTCGGCPSACTDIAAANLCRQWSNNRQCSRRAVKRWCKKTCGGCPSACKNTAHDIYCRRWSNQRLCSDPYVSQRCLKTCGNC